MNATVFLVLLTSLLTVAASTFDRAYAIGEEPTETYVIFSSPMSVGSVLNWAAEKGATPLELVHEYPYGADRVIAAGYEMDPQLSRTEADSEYRSELSSSLDDMEVELQTDLPDTSEDLQHVQSIRSDLAAGNAPVSHILVLATPSTLVSVRLDPAVSEAYSKAEADALPQEPAIPGDCGNWWPYTGRIATRPSTSQNRRYVYQSFRWSTTGLNNLLDCHERITYEAEAWYDQYDGLYYLGGRVVRWLSSMPRSYKDTEAFPASDERGYTIGTSDATRLAANRRYTTYMRTNLGNASTDRGKVNGSRGHRRWPGSCHRSWCIAQDKTEFLLPAWQHVVPGSTAWAH